ncbi:hypothetical protein CN163_15005 [Sinorhizobium meliloti]|nr:hypothetical protein CN163_15005 [Sinorhizobium meliloti]
MPTAPQRKRIEGLQSLLLPHPCACHRVPAAPRLRRGEEFFQPNDMGWLDSCDEHRNEEIKQAAGYPKLNTL